MFVNFLKQISPTKNPISIIQAINIAIRKVFVLDRLEKVFSYYRAREVVVGSAEKAFNRALKIVDKANTTRELAKAKKQAQAKAAEAASTGDTNNVIINEKV